jgi:nucleotide-binding universal stress UspA family protein
MAEVRKFDVEFDATVTRDVIKTMHEVSNRVHCEWLVMQWEERKRDRFTPFTPLGWLVNHLSANLALLKDAGVRYTREIIAVSNPKVHGELVADTADHLAGVLGANLTLVSFVSNAEPDTEVTKATAYLDGLRKSCRGEAKTLVVRGKDEIATLTELTAAYDLLVMDAPNRGFLGQVFGTAADRLTTAAACSVLRIKTPKNHDSPAASS